MKPELKIDKHGNRRWYLNDELHRTDGPAVECANGDKLWWLNGKLHRTDGPACEYANGTRRWYVYGKQHRTDGPACEYESGDYEWFLYSNEFSFAEWLELTPVSEQHKLHLALLYSEHV